MSRDWPTTVDALEAMQREIAIRAAEVEPWRPTDLSALGVGAVFACFPTRQSGPGAAGDPGWAAATVFEAERAVASAVVRGEAGAPYLPGLLALQCGPLLQRAVETLNRSPDVLLVNATGRDHPRRAGLALHLGAVLDLPTIGITDRPLVAREPEPEADRAGAVSLVFEGEVVAFKVWTRRRSRPVVVHAGWRIDLETATAIVLATATRARTPEPLRLARRLARIERARGEGRLPPGPSSGVVV